MKTYVIEVRNCFNGDTYLFAIDSKNLKDSLTFVLGLELGSNLEITFKLDKETK